MDIKLCGIDEAGRGCIAGSLAIAGVILLDKITGLNDSKKLSQSQREKLEIEIKRKSLYHIVIVSSEIIDRIGLSLSIKNSIIEIMEKLKADRYIFDGNTTYNIQNLESLVKADSLIAEVSAASILAKVSRDRELLELGQNYLEYNFKQHKGYITKEHIEEIKKFGYSPLHRKSYKIKSLKQGVLEL